MLYQPMDLEEDAMDVGDERAPLVGPLSGKEESSKRQALLMAMRLRAEEQAEELWAPLDIARLVYVPLKQKQVDGRQVGSRLSPGKCCARRGLVS